MEVAEFEIAVALNVRIRGEAVLILGQQVGEDFVPVLLDKIDLQESLPDQE